MIIFCVFRQENWLSIQKVSRILQFTNQVEVSKRNQTKYLYFSMWIDKNIRNNYI